jgi:adhesin HecA-like repeat protein
MGLPPAWVVRRAVDHPRQPGTPPGFTATGEIALAGAHIGGRLDLHRATLANPDGPALSAARLTVDQDMFCSEGFTARGEVVLLGAHIGGSLDLRGATLTNPDGPALIAAGLTVDQEMLPRETPLALR